MHHVDLSDVEEGSDLYNAWMGRGDGNASQNPVGARKGRRWTTGTNKITKSSLRACKEKELREQVCDKHKTTGRLL